MVVTIFGYNNRAIALANAKRTRLVNLRFSHPDFRNERRYKAIRSLVKRCVLRFGISARLLSGTLLGCVSCMAVGQIPPPPQLPPAQHVTPPNPERQIPAYTLPGSVPNGFTVAAVGDLIITYPQSQIRDPGFLAVEKILQSADVTFGNFEDNIVDPLKSNIWPAPENGAAAINAPPQTAEDLKKMGFDLLSYSNNHSLDWGIRGMQETEKALDQAGLVYAGTGKNLAAARAPGYLTTPYGRIALVSMTSTFTPMEPAGRPLRGVAGRPGVSALHTTVTHIVTTQQMEDLVQIYNDQPDKPKHPAAVTTDQLRLFGAHYQVGPEDAQVSTMDPYDLDEILRSIREGKEASNFEIVYIHAHNPGNWSTMPATFTPTLAHDAIDAGADEFIASGPHRLRGIEIYKGKPIFYSLGNFFFQNPQFRALDPDLIQQSHLNVATSTDSEIQQYRIMTPDFGAPIWFQSVVAVSEFNSKGDVREIKLYPINLGYQRIPRVDIGRPRIASHDLAVIILKRLQELSAPYGTHIVIQGNVGIIRIAAK